MRMKIVIILMSIKFDTGSKINTTKKEEKDV